MNTHADIVRHMLLAIGEDPERSGLKETPERVAKSWRELFEGYRAEAGALLKTFDLTEYDQMVVLSGIPVFSFCEHHMLPFFGTVAVGYVPDGKRVVGISKLARLVDCFARRLQIQERLTMQIGEALLEHLKPLGAGVVVDATHTCMIARGVRKGGTLRTSWLGGALRDDAAARAEFFALVGGNG